MPPRLKAEKKLTGLPPQTGVGATGETTLTDKYVFDANGLDPERMALDEARKVLWTSDEYSPFIARIAIYSGAVDVEGAHRTPTARAPEHSGRKL